MWELYLASVARGVSPRALAEEFDVTEGYATVLCCKAKLIMRASGKIDPDASDLHREMRKMFALGVDSMERNLIEGEPRVTVAFMQGIGALIPKQEITSLTDEEREIKEKQTIAALNPRLKKILTEEDGVEVKVEPN